MSEMKLIKWEKRRVGPRLLDQCSILKYAIGIGRDFIKHFKNAQSADIYYNKERTVIGLVPRDDDLGFSIRRRRREGGIYYVGTRKVMQGINMKLGVYKADWTKMKVANKETDMLLIKIK